MATAFQGIVDFTGLAAGALPVIPPVAAFRGSVDWTGIPQGVAPVAAFRGSVDFTGIPSGMAAVIVPSPPSPVLAGAGGGGGSLSEPTAWILPPQTSHEDAEEEMLVALALLL